MPTTFSQPTPKASNIAAGQLQPWKDYLRAFADAVFEALGPAAQREIFHDNAKTFYRI